MKIAVNVAMLFAALAWVCGVRAASEIDPATLQSLIDSGEGQAVVSQMERLLENQQPSTADVHYWLAEGQLAQIEAASTFRKLGLARAGRKNLLKALELEPAHVPALSSLGQYYLEAPGIAGGSRKKAAEQADALMSLDKAAGLRLKADIAWKEEDPPAAIAYDREALAASSWDWDFQYTLVVRAVHYKVEDAEGLLDEAESNVRQHAGGDARRLRLIDYQRGKYAAVSGRALDAGRAGLGRYLGFDPGPEDPDPAWAEFRLAQVERQLGETAAADARLARLEAGNVSEDLGFALQDERRWHYED